MPDEADALLERLPELLAQRPQLRYRIYDILAERFVEKAEFNRLLEEIRASREESNRRFEEAREESNRRFEEAREESDRRFEALHRQIDRRYEETDAFNKDTRHFVNVVVGGFQRHAGSGLEDAVAGTLRVALKTRDLDPSTLKLDYPRKVIITLAKTAELAVRCDELGIELA